MDKRTVKTMRRWRQRRICDFSRMIREVCFRLNITAEALSLHMENVADAWYVRHCLLTARGPIPGQPEQAYIVKALCELAQYPRNLIQLTGDSPYWATDQLLRAVYNWVCHEHFEPSDTVVPPRPLCVTNAAFDPKFLLDAIVPSHSKPRKAADGKAK